ncbi:hypothetical protein FACS1894169_02960 [Bacteroidia bacterium]|nr:hypothetical protein FACS1894169_02960 [Bacteroidia bacterium]
MKNFFLIVLCCFSLNIWGTTQKGLIEISTENTSIILGVSLDGKVCFLHWGEKIKDIQAFMDKPFIKQPDTNDNMAPQLYPAYGGRYYLEPALKLTHNDGALTTSLIYDSLDKVEIDDNRTEFTIKLKDKIYPVYVDVRFVCYKKEDVICQSVTIYHNEDKTLKVENLASSYIPIHAESYYLTHFHGTWAAEMQMEEEKLRHGIKVIETKKGVRATQAENPSFLISVNTPSNEDAGEIYAGTLAWSGNYKLAFEIGETGELFITGGMNPFASTYNLKAGEKLTSPEMILTYSPAGKGEISRNYHDWARAYGMAHGDRTRPILLNSWEGAYFSFEENTITSMIDNAANFGIEMFVLDDGWFGNKYPRNGDNAGLGDWQVNEKKLPRGISYLAGYAVNKGLQFGIWIEPEMVNPDSELAKKHPEWIVKSGKRDILPMRNQWLLDLSNPEVQDFVFETFDNVVSLSKNITYVKWDANRHVDNAGSEYLTKDNQTHFWLFMVGLCKGCESDRNSSV